MNPLKNRHSECELSNKYVWPAQAEVGWEDLLQGRAEFEICNELITVSGGPSRAQHYCRPVFSLAVRFKTGTTAIGECMKQDLTARFPLKQNSLIVTCRQIF